MMTEGTETIGSQTPKANGTPPPPPFGSKRAFTMMSPPGGKDDAMQSALDDIVIKALEGQPHCKI